MIKTVLFDYGGVLSVGGQSFRGTLAQLLNCDIAELNLDRLGNADLWTGKITSQQFFEEISRRHGQTITVDQFLEASRIVHKSKPVYQLANQLREAGLQTAILSNMYESSAVLLKASGCYDGFAPVILSFQEGVAKPNPEIYRRAVERLGQRPEEILFIDDQEVFLAPAREIGMQVIKAENEAQIVADTKKLLAAENGLKL